MSNDTSARQSTMRSVLDTLLQLSFPYVVVVSAIGICGNILIIILLSKRSIAKNFNNCTLIALALTDLLFNFMLVSRCINDLTRSNSEQLCRLLSFLSHLAELLSACFTAQFTAQRFIAVRFPLSVFVEKKIHLIHYFVVSLSILFGIIYCISLVKNTDYQDCHEELELMWFLSDALLSFLIPFTIIIVMNILTVIQLKKGLQHNPQFRFTKRTQQSEPVPVNSRQKKPVAYQFALSKPFRSKIYENIPSPTSKAGSLQQRSHDELLPINGRVRSIDLLQRPSVLRKKTQSYRVTRMLILVSTCFLLFNAPFHICTIGLKMYMVKQSIATDRSLEISLPLPNHVTPLNQTSSTEAEDAASSHRVGKTSHEHEMTSDLRRMEFIYLIVVITQYISHASYSINFFLYSFCGMKFRRELVRFITKHRQQLRTTRSLTVQNTL